MGLFSIFGKKDLEAEQKLLKKIEELEQTIARKDKEISDLINELDRVNQSIPNTNTATKLIKNNVLKITIVIPNQLHGLMLSKAHKIGS